MFLQWETQENAVLSGEYYIRPLTEEVVPRG